MENQPALKFLRFEVSKILFDRGDDPKPAGKYKIDVKLESQMNSENPNLIRALFIIDISDDKESVNAQVKAIGVFEIVGDADEDLRQNFYNISAPAIVFPYIRAFAGNLFLQSGLNPIIIPPLNFSANPEKPVHRPKKSTKTQKSHLPKKLSTLKKSIN